jgi:uncharacterized membrane protein YhaH (DUF805 family)
MERDSRNIISTLTGKRWHDAAYWSLMALFCALFLIMNLLTTLKVDDMGFALVDGEWTPVRSLADLLRSCRNHYLGTNGRTSDLFAILFCGLLGKGAFNVCNTLVFGLMAHLVSLLATGRRSVLALLATVTVVGTCYPVPSETMLWLAGSCNYMWAITASLLFVYYLLHHGKQPGWGRGVLLVLAGAVAGSFNEATSFGFFAGLCLYYVFNRKRFDRTALLGMAGYLLGVLIIVASPAAWERASSGGIVIDLEAGQLLSSRWYIFAEKMERFLVPLMALAVGVVALLLRRWRTVKQSVWTYVFMCLLLVVFALGMIHERVYAPLVTVAMIVVVMAAGAWLKRWPWLRLAVIACALALSLFTFGRGIKALYEYKAFDDQAIEEIVSAPHQAVLRARHFNKYSRFINPMNFNSTNYFAQEVVYCGYFDKDNVQFVTDSVYERYHSNRLLDGAKPWPIKSDRPDVTDTIYTIPGQDYMVVTLKHALPHTFQMARYYMAQPDVTMTAQEKEHRANYGLTTEYTPQGFYPLYYQGRHMLIFPMNMSGISHIVFPLELGLTPKEATLNL